MTKKIKSHDTVEVVEHKTMDMELKSEPIIIGGKHALTIDNHTMFSKSWSKKEKIEFYFNDIMRELGLDMTDDSLKDTPRRVAKMFVDEIFYGLDNEKFPKISTFENKYDYDQMLIETNIDVKSVCEHHFQPIFGNAHIAYIPGKKVVGLSKLNRVVDYFARRPQVQERLTKDIMEKLKELLEVDDVAVTIDAKHFCVIMRGIQHNSCVTRSTALSGAFKTNENTRREYFNAIGKAQ